MKKIVSIFILVLMCCCLFCACDGEKIIDPNIEDKARFQYIGKSTITQNGNTEAGDLIQYYLDNETQIVYITIVNRSTGNGAWAGFTPLIDADGTYTTYNEFKKYYD